MLVVPHIMDTQGKTATGYKQQEIISGTIENSIGFNLSHKDIRLYLEATPLGKAASHADTVCGYLEAVMVIGLV